MTEDREVAARDVARLWVEDYPSLATYKGVKTSHEHRTAPVPPDITGQRFYRLTAVRWTGERSALGALWVFRCDCGGERIVAAPQTRAGKVRQCRACGRAAQGKRVPAASSS